jgi:CRP-like cAMP-binding protein
VDVEGLRAEWYRAVEKNRPQDAVKALAQLEQAEPFEPRWSQRLGEAYRRTGQMKEAVDAFARAFEGYFSRGFLPRAIAMAKLVKSMDAARGDLLERSLPATGAIPPPLPFARAIVEPPPANATREPPPGPPKPVVKPPPLPTSDAPKPARSPSGETTAVRPAPPPPPPPLAPFQHESALPPPRLPSSLKVVKPAPLARAADSQADEVRFEDAPESSIEILLEEFEPSDVILLEDDDLEDDDAPSTKQVAGGEAWRAPAHDAYASLAAVRLFASLSRDALVALADAAELVEFVPGAMIIVRDERAFALYAIVSGTARVIVAGSPEIRLREGDVFGEASLLDEGTRQADVKAETQLMTLRIEKEALDAVTARYPEVEHALFDLLARRLVTNLMHTSRLFASFEPPVRLELAQKFEVRRAEAGTVLAERGRRSDGLYILLAGNVMAEPENGTATRIARGTAFGHASLLGKGPADVTVRAITEAVLLRMPASGFASLAALYPPALAHLAETANEPLPASTREP